MKRATAATSAQTTQAANPVPSPPNNPPLLNSLEEEKKESDLDEKESEPTLSVLTGHTPGPAPQLSTPPRNPNASAEALHCPIPGCDNNKGRGYSRAYFVSQHLPSHQTVLE